jgi:putative membrane protein
MKKIIRISLLFAFALATQNQLWGNLSFDNGLGSILKVSLILMIFELLIKPILKLLLLPINLLTLGLFRIVINTLGFYLAVFLLSDFQVDNIATKVSHIFGFTVPSMHFSGFGAYIITSMTVSLLLYLFNQVLRKKA